MKKGERECEYENYKEEERKKQTYLGQRSSINSLCLKHHAISKYFKLFSFCFFSSLLGIYEVILKDIDIKTEQKE